MKKTIIPTTAEELEKMLDLYDKGLSLRQIGTLVGKSYQTIKKYTDKYRPVDKNDKVKK